MCTGMSVSCLLLFLLCVTGCIKVSAFFFFCRFFLLLLPLGSFVIQKVITRYLLKESTLTLLFNERNVPSVMIREAQIFIARDSKSFRRPLWLGSQNHLTLYQDGGEISEPGPTACAYRGLPKGRSEATSTGWNITESYTEKTKRTPQPPQQRTHSETPENPLAGSGGESSTESMLDNFIGGEALAPQSLLHPYLTYICPWLIDQDTSYTRIPLSKEKRYSKNE